MNRKYVFHFIVMCILLVGIIAFLNMPMPIPSEIHNYTGTLISFEPHDLLHGGYLISSTLLRFADGASFTVDGAGTYILGVQYTIDYEKAMSVTKVTSITSPSQELPQSVQKSDHIVLRCIDMDDIVIALSEDPPVYGETDILGAILNDSQIQTYSEFKNGSKILFIFYYALNCTMINSAHMNYQPFYTLQYDPRSHVVHVW